MFSSFVSLVLLINMDPGKCLILWSWQRIVTQRSIIYVEVVNHTRCRCYTNILSGLELLCSMELSKLGNSKACIFGIDHCWNFETWSVGLDTNVEFYSCIRDYLWKCNVPYMLCSAKVFSLTIFHPRIGPDESVVSAYCALLVAVRVAVGCLYSELYLPARELYTKDE